MALPIEKAVRPSFILMVQNLGVKTIDFTGLANPPSFILMDQKNGGLMEFVTDLMALPSFYPMGKNNGGSTEPERNDLSRSRR